MWSKMSWAMRGMIPISWGSCSFPWTQQQQEFNKTSRYDRGNNMNTAKVTWTRGRAGALFKPTEKDPEDSEDVTPSRAESLRNQTKMMHKIWRVFFVCLFVLFVGNGPWGLNLSLGAGGTVTRIFLSVNGKFQGLWGSEAEDQTELQFKLKMFFFSIIVSVNLYIVPFIACVFVTCPQRLYGRGLASCLTPACLHLVIYTDVH